jgi:hypothetical protein
VINSIFSWYWGSSNNPHPVAWRVFHDSNSWTSEVLAYNRDYTGNSAETWRAGWARRHALFGTALGGETAKTLGYDLTYADSDTIYWVTNQFAFKGHYVDSGAQQLDFQPLYTVENRSMPDQWRSTGIDNITATLIEANHDDPDTLYIGLQDIGCWVSRDAGEYWASCNYFHDYLDPLPEDWRGINFPTGKNEYKVALGGNVYALLSDPASPSELWISSSPGQRNSDWEKNLVVTAHGRDGSTWLTKRGDQMLTYSPDAGRSWIRAASMPRNSRDVYGLSLDSKDETHNTLLVTIDGEVYQTHDGKNPDGASWNRLESNCHGGCQATAIDTDGIYYTGGVAGLFYSRDKGANWTAWVGPWGKEGFASDGNPVFHDLNWRGISNIRPDPNQSGTILISVFQSAANNADTLGGIYRCTVTPTTCTQLLGNRDTPTPYVRDVAIDPSDSDILYASSSSAYTGPGYDNRARGIYRSVDGGLTWDLDNAGLSWSSAFPLAISRAAPKVVYTGSIGPGYYRRDIASRTHINYKDAFQGATPSTGWSYLWNASGPIGDNTHYTPMIWNGYRYQSDQSTDPDATGFAYENLNKNGGHPGLGISQGTEEDRYAIAAHQVNDAGNYRLINTKIAAACTYSNGLDLRVYVNNQLVTNVDVAQGEPLDFNIDLGTLVSNDHIYVAVGPDEHDGCDGFTLDYTIEKEQ